MGTKANKLTDIQYLSQFISENKEDSKIISKLKEYAEQLLNKKDDDFIVPEWHKDLVRKRIRNSKPKNMIPLEDLDKYITA